MGMTVAAHMIEKPRLNAACMRLVKGDRSGCRAHALGSGLPNAGVPGRRTHGCFFSDVVDLDVEWMYGQQRVTAR